LWAQKKAGAGLSKRGSGVNGVEGRSMKGLRKKTQKIKRFRRRSGAKTPRFGPPRKLDLSLPEKRKAALLSAAKRRAGEILKREWHQRVVMRVPYIRDGGSESFLGKADSWEARRA